MKDRTKLYGKMMGVTAEGQFISCELDSTLNFDKDMIPVSSVQSGKWAEYVQVNAIGRSQSTWLCLNQGHLKTLRHYLKPI